MLYLRGEVLVKGAVLFSVLWLIGRLCNDQMSSFAVMTCICNISLNMPFV